MKKTWMEPRIMVQEFVANEYVAACYKIHCTTPKGNSFYEKIVNDANGNGEYDSGDNVVYQSRLSFYGCNNWHKGVIRDSAPTANGFVVRSEKSGRDWKEVAEPVFWWKESFRDGSVNYHVMVPGAENYESNPNAS